MQNNYKLKWWGYLHTNGELKLKRYFDNSCIEDAKEGMYGAGFVTDYYGPFEAEDSSRAYEILKFNILLKINNNITNKKVEIV